MTSIYRLQMTVKYFLPMWNQELMGTKQKIEYNKLHSRDVYKCIIQFLLP